MKKLLTVFAVLVAMGSAKSAYAEVTLRDLFRETEGSVIDWAIASSVEAGYARDLLGGKNYAIVQFPVLFVTPYVTADFGYISGYDDKVRGAVAFGGSLRINRLIEDAFTGKVGMVRRVIPVLDKTWDHLWVGPFISKRFSDFDNTLLAGIKTGLRW